MAQRAPAAVRVLDVLRVVSEQPEPVAAANIARRLGLARSTTYYLLQVLIDHGYVIHHEELNRYGLGVAAHELGSAYRRQVPLQRAATPIMNALVDAAGHNAHFSALHGTDVVYLIEERAPGRSALISDIGVRLQAHLTASGLSQLACLPQAQVRALFPSRDAFSTRLGLGPASPRELRDALVDVRRRGYALETGWVMAGLSSVAAAATDSSGHPAGAFTLTFDDAYLDDVQALAAHVRRAARRLTDRLSR